MVRKFRRVRQTLYHKARLETLLAVYEGITERVFGRTYALRSNSQYHLRVQDASSLWHPEILDRIGSDGIHGAGPNGVEPGDVLASAGVVISESSV